MDAMRGKVFHYRDKTGLEADAVLSLPDGRWAPVEVKMGHKAIDADVRHLMKLAERVDIGHEGTPSFLMVLTSTEAAYRREDGVFVVPLACLAPRHQRISKQRGAPFGAPLYLGGGYLIDPAIRSDAQPSR